VVSVGALDALESTGTPKSAGQNLRYVMHLVTPLIARAKAAIQDGRSCAEIAGINDIPVSSKPGQHPKTQPVLVRSGNIKSPGGIGRRTRRPRINRYSEKCRQNLRYVMHLVTPLIARAKAAIQDGHPRAGIAGINDIPISSKPDLHPKTQSVLVRSGNIKGPGGNS
jgi:hypothetical protein